MAKRATGNTSFETRDARDDATIIVLLGEVAETLQAIERQGVNALLRPAGAAGQTVATASPIQIASQSAIQQGSLTREQLSRNIAQARQRAALGLIAGQQQPPTAPAGQPSRQGTGFGIVQFAALEAVVVGNTLAFKGLIERVHEFNRSLANISPSQAIIKAMEDIRTLFRNMRIGEETAESAQRLSTALADFKDALVPIQAKLLDAFNDSATAVLNFGRSVLEWASRISIGAGLPRDLKALADGFERLVPIVNEVINRLTALASAIGDRAAVAPKQTTLETVKGAVYLASPSATIDLVKWMFGGGKNPLDIAFKKMGDVGAIAEQRNEDLEASQKFTPSKTTEIGTAIVDWLRGISKHLENIRNGVDDLNEKPGSGDRPLAMGEWLDKISDRTKDRMLEPEPEFAPLAFK